MEWYEWVIPLAFGVLVFISDIVVTYFRLKEYCEFWHLDFKEEWKKNVKMKPGDKVWFFDARTQTIVYEEALEVNERGGVVYTYNKNLWLGREAFPTREALCEHYRKIFE